MLILYSKEFNLAQRGGWPLPSAAGRSPLSSSSIFCDGAAPHSLTTWFMVRALVTWHWLDLQRDWRWRSAVGSQLVSM